MTLQFDDVTVKAIYSGSFLPVFVNIYFSLRLTLYKISLRYLYYFSGHDRFKTELFPSVLLTCFVGIEDLEDYHGKALVDKGKAAVEKLKEGLVNDKHNLGPQPVVDDAPAVNLSAGTIKLSEPPNYKIRGN